MTSLKAIPRKQIFVAVIIFTALMVAPGPDPAAQPAWAEKICNYEGCLVIQNDHSLTDGALEEEVKSLVDTLAIRLGKNGIMVMARLGAGKNKRVRLRRPKGSDGSSCTTFSGEPQWFIVHLQDLSDKTLLVALDYLGSRVEDDMVREVEKGPDPAATAWTLALMLEDALAPYLEGSKDSPAIGAGLALIEPPEVGGASGPDDLEPIHEEEEDTDGWLHLKGLSLEAVTLSLSSAYLTAVRDVVLGPRLSLSVNLGSRYRASMSSGWLGISRFERKNLDISINYFPFELMFGAVFSPSEMIEVVALGGVSAVLTTYDVSGGASDSRKTVFSPWLSARVQVLFEIHGPLCAGAHVGLAVPIIRDHLKSDDSGVYRQDWGMPLMGVDFVYRLP